MESVWQGWRQAGTGGRGRRRGERETLFNFLKLYYTSTKNKWLKCKGVVLPA